jgi:hypothetical protein
MIIRVPFALNKLGIKEWSLSHEPSTEEEFLEFFTKFVGTDEAGHAIPSKNPEDFGVTWTQIQNTLNQIDLEYEQTQYQRDRVKEYPPFADQFDTLYHGGYDAWKAQIDEIKNKYPKPE